MIVNDTTGVVPAQPTAAGIAIDARRLPGHYPARPLRLAYQPATAPSVPAAVAPGPSRLLSLLAIPSVDKAVAVLASAPFAYFAYLWLSAGPVDLPRGLLLFQISLCIVTMLIRRTPVRVTSNIWFWLVAFVATYWGLLTATMTQKGTPIAPGWLTDGLSVLALWVGIAARLSLGRNIGFVPAQRRIVTYGAYRYVRHPIYTAIFFASLAFLLRAYSLPNLIVTGIACGLWVVKTFMEESFLSEDAEYTAYKKKVRWRWLPGLA